MDITEVRIKLIGNSDDRLRAFCSITIDGCFVIRDLKIIDGTSGVFVAMPSRKLSAHCPRCSCKNHLKAGFCNQCGVQLKEEVAVKDQEGRAKLYADIAHPINSACREMIQERVIAEYRAELRRAEDPHYVSRYDDDFGSPPEVELPDERHVDKHEPGPRPPHTGSRPTKFQNDASRDDDAEDDSFGAGIL